MRTSARIGLAMALLATMLTWGTGVAASDQPTVYLVLGESILAPEGFGASSPDKAAPALLFDYFQQQGVADTAVNLAVGGEWSGGFVGFPGNGNRPDPDSQLGRTLAVIDDPTTDVSVITFLLGGNDVAPDPCFPDHTTGRCRGAATSNINGFSRRLPAILDTLNRALAGDPGQERVLVATVYNPLSGMGDDFTWYFEIGGWESFVEAGMTGADGEIDCAGRGREIGVNDVIACSAPRYGATVVDVWSLFDGHAADYTSIEENNDTHPDDFGHAVIAQAFIDAYEQ